MKLTRRVLTKAPFVDSARKVYWKLRSHNSHKGPRRRIRFRWPIFELSCHFFNREPKHLYRLAKTTMKSMPIETRVDRELKENGISVIQVSDLLPAQQFSDIQELSHILIQKPGIQERIKAIEAGDRPKARSDKFFLVRPFGDRPVFDVTDKFLGICISDPILRIVSGYLGMFGRLIDIELWYNAVTDGPDVYSQRWHRDNDDRHIVKMFLYLRDVDEMNGPFCYIPRTHNRGPYKRLFPQTIEAGGNYAPLGDVVKTFATFQKQICVGKAGTLIFADTSGFHRGGHPTGGGRLLFHAYYATNASLPMIKRDKRYSVHGLRRGLVGSAAEYAIRHAAE